MGLCPKPRRSAGETPATLPSEWGSAPIGINLRPWGFHPQPPTRGFIPLTPFLKNRFAVFPVKVFVQTFFKKFAGCGTESHMVLIFIVYPNSFATKSSSFGISIFCGQCDKQTPQLVQSLARLPSGIILYKAERFHFWLPRWSSLYNEKQVATSIFSGHLLWQYLQ